MIRWGVLGIGNIAMRFIKSLANSENGCLYAAASYTAAKRTHFHEQYPDIVVYDDYIKLLDDPKVDAVYIATRHGDHYQYAKEALQRKKAVLCEKPATLSYQQTLELCQLAQDNQTFFLEAMKTRFVPLVEEIKKVIASKEIGDVLRVETSFCYDVDYREGHYLFDQDQGGILYDVSTYNLATILDYIHSPVQSLKTKMERKFNVDAYDLVEFTFESGQTALVEIALDRQKDKVMTIIGTFGSITAEPFYRPNTALICVNGKEHIIHKDYIHDDFFTEIEEVHRCLKEHLIESPRMTFQDSLDIIMMIEMIKESFDD